MQLLLQNARPHPTGNDHQEDPNICGLKPHWSFLCAKEGSQPLQKTGIKLWTGWSSSRVCHEETEFWLVYSYFLNFKLLFSDSCPCLRFMLNAWLHVRVINFRIIIIIIIIIIIHVTQWHRKFLSLDWLYIYDLRDWDRFLMNAY